MSSYPIHNSRSFLVTPSLASSMYLMVMYFMTGNYQNVFKMIESCVSEELTPEEVSVRDRSASTPHHASSDTCHLYLFLQRQIFNQLEFLGNDYHPDAHACRLKLSVVTVGLGGDGSMTCP